MTDISFNNARGAASTLQMSPPFAFSDVTMSVFPLRASLPSLENFCRNYLNQAPNLVQFRPFVPFVYLVILDYGRMSLEAANMGWVSQREVAFGIPLRWLNTLGDELAFHDWAFSSPFIFVDNELSMSTGREVYGWPKLLARLDPSVSEWVHNPHGARRVFQVSTKGTTEAYAGQMSEYRPLLSVFQHRTAGLLDIPPNLDAVVKPLSQVTDATMGLTRLGVELAKTFVGMASDRITGSAVMPDLMDMDTFRAQLSTEKMRAWRSSKGWLPGIKDAMWSLFPRLYANTINFKQFRDAANPHGTCYQALTSARMPVKAFKEGGFLGPQNMLLGQLDGGFRIDIHHLASLPIIESLGLEVSEERMIGDQLVSTLAPVAPLWMKVDMTYGIADTLIWRGRAGKWTEGQALKKAKAAAEAYRNTKTVAETLLDDITASGTKDDATRTPSKAQHEAVMLGEIAIEDAPDELDDGQGFDYIRAMNTFNTARGASEAVGGTFSIPDASVRVLPLKADPAVLQTFVKTYLKVDKKMRFEAWGDYVYLVISDFKQMNSELSAISKRRARELSLLVPVKCYDWFEEGAYAQSGHPIEAEADAGERRRRGEEKLLTTGFVNAFTYVDDVETAITANEVFGVPSMGSAIRASENEWLSRDLSKERNQHEILSMQAQVLPELMAGARAVDRTLVDVSTHHPHHPMVQESEDEAVNNWVELLADDLEQKVFENGTEASNCGQGFALKLLGGSLAFNQFSLKQFRDSHRTQNACYQGLILRRHSIDKLTDLREIDAPIHVSITDYPTQPITQVLGLRPKFTYPGRDRLVRVFEAVRPFSLNGDLRRGAGSTLFERVNSSKWKRVDITEEIFGWRTLPLDQIAQFVEDFEDTDTCEMAYEFENPETGATVEKRLRRVGKAFFKSWYKKRVATCQVRNVMIRFRDQNDAVGVYTQAGWEDFSFPDDVNLAAWTSQMKHNEEEYSQAYLASLIEQFSPATVIDRVLAQRWGISNTSDLPAFKKNDFCVPVNAVPSRFADRLFPKHERLNGYWPQSVEHYNHQKSKRKSEFFAFKVELNTSIRTFALMYPGVLHDHLPDGSDEWSVDWMITAVSDALNTYRDDKEKAEEAKRHTRRAIEDIENEENMGDVMRAAEAVVVHFFESHLPEIFWLVPGKDSEKYAFGFTQAGSREATLEEWKAALKGFQDVSVIIRRSLNNDSEADDAILQFLEPFIEKANTKIQELQARGDDPALPGQLFSNVPEDIEFPHDVLRDRLHEAITG